LTSAWGTAWGASWGDTWGANQSTQAAQNAGGVDRHTDEPLALDWGRVHDLDADDDAIIMAVVALVASRRFH
jgi:hypothetical protein